VEEAYRLFLGRGSDPGGKAAHLKNLAQGMPRTEVIKQLVSSDEYFSLLAGKKALDPENGPTADEFVEICYQLYLQRPADAEGKKGCLTALEKGASRLEVIKRIVSSEEYRDLLLGRKAAPTHLVQLPNLRQVRPDQYFLTPSILADQEILTFEIRQPGDYDWLEEMISRHGYYDRPGGWEMGIDQDKETIAQIVGGFAPQTSLEIGCSSGAVVSLLREAGVQAEGVEISHLALALCHPQAKGHIHFGDLLHLDLEPKYDLILGMDIFEHLNPNKLGAYLVRCHGLLRPGGWLLANIPAYGPDPLFGDVHKICFERWEQEAQGQGLFSLLHVDREGWPIHGHLTWATWQWWQNRFQESGFKRETGVEKALQAVFDNLHHRRESARPASARYSLFAFAKGGAPPQATERVIGNLHKL
jgi:SAM-dependent methyltransferase